MYKGDVGFSKEFFAAGLNRHSTILERKAQEQLEMKKKKKKRELKEQGKLDSKKAAQAARSS